VVSIFKVPLRGVAKPKKTPKVTRRNKGKRREYIPSKTLLQKGSIGRVTPFVKQGIPGGGGRARKGGWNLRAEKRPSRRMSLPREADIFLQGGG